MAVVYGRIDGKNVPTRLHRANLIRDMFGGTNSVARVLRHFKREGQGVIVSCATARSACRCRRSPRGRKERREERRAGLRRRAPAAVARDRARRADPQGLGISSIRLLTAAKHRYVGLAGFGNRDRVDRADRGVGGCPGQGRCSRACGGLNGDEAAPRVTMPASVVGETRRPMAECLHCQINELVKAHLENDEQVDLDDLVARIVESAAELIADVVPGRGAGSRARHRHQPSRPFVPGEDRRVRRAVERHAFETRCM